MYLVYDAKVLVISPVSNNSFIESVKLRSIRKARFRFVIDILSSFAISERVDLAVPFWHSLFPCSPFLYPFNST